MKPESEFHFESILPKDLMDMVQENPQIFMLPMAVEAPAYVWLSVQGALDLALRHPRYIGPSREVADAFRKELLAELVARGLLPASVAAEALREDAVAQADNEDLRKGESRIILPGELVCMHCGCTDRRACPNQCHWVRVDREAGVGVCSNCA